MDNRRGNIPKREEVVKQLDFSDSQYEKFMCLCDAKRFVAQKLLAENTFTTKRG
jgi:hypothetical protein